MRSNAAVLLSLALAICAAPGTFGCSSGGQANATGFPAAAFQTFTTDEGQLKVELRLSPQPPVAGLDEVQYRVTDATTGTPVDGLSIAIVPWMPAMGHGASVTPIPTPRGDGIYDFTNVSLFMPGEWQLRTQFSGQVADSAAPTFSVP